MQNKRDTRLAPLVGQVNPINGVVEVIGAGVGAVVAVSALQKLTLWLKKAPRYSTFERKRHYLLTNAYTRFLKDSPPNDWQLDAEHRPIIHHSIDKVKISLSHLVKGLEATIPGGIYQCARLLHTRLGGIGFFYLRI